MIDWTVSAHPVTPASREKYWATLTTVFTEADPGQLRSGMNRLGPSAQFFAVEIAGEFASVLFVTEVVIRGHRLGGVGGVCTRPEYRGQGFGSAVLSRAVRESSSEYRGLLLWTRIPEYFRRHGFVSVDHLFCSQPGGSSPMMVFYEAALAKDMESSGPLPRDYF